MTPNTGAAAVTKSPWEDRPWNAPEFSDVDDADKNAFLRWYNSQPGNYYEVFLSLFAKPKRALTWRDVLDTKTDGESRISVIIRAVGGGYDYFQYDGNIYKISGHDGYVTTAWTEADIDNGTALVPQEDDRG